MTVITISRQFGSHGDTVAQLLCDRLGYRYFDKNLMLGLAAAAGMTPEAVVDLSDEKYRARSLVQRLFSNYPAPMADPTAWAAGAEASAQEKAQAAHVKQLIRATHAQGNVVVVGRGGQVVLRDLPDVLHVRLIAPLELRIRRHAGRAGLTEAAAREAVLARDKASADFVKYYYDADVADSTLYDLIINTGKLTPSAAADLIIGALAYLPRNPASAAGK
jgi:cytidylate kinase